ncbi:amino acid adenylation domain-containing protein [Paraburkholderia xenovorans]|uniref:amino acid adenylation domain-containing protein n=1 Tax=Paraburkholderia xenovorans TaxID=36873 RepID=UPI0038BD4C3F
MKQPPAAQDNAGNATAVRDRRAISVKYAALSADKRAQLRARVVELNIDPAQLPIVPIAARTGADAGSAPLSGSQAQLWFLARLEPDSAAYHVSGGVRLDGALDEHRLRAGVASLVERHESLRTRIVERDGEPLQIADAYHAEQAARLCEFHDLREGGEAAPQTRIDAFAQAFSLRPFDLERGPLWRIAFLTIGAHAHLLLLTMHHLIADGWSIGVLVKDFVAGYADPTDAGTQPREALPIQFRDYVVWQNEWRDDAREAADLAYWRSRLGESHEPLALPYDRARNGARSTHGARVVRVLDARRAHAWRAFVRSRRGTVSAAMLAVFDILLARHSGQRELRVGMPLANRDRAETAGLIGCFVNTVVIDAQPDSAAPFDALLSEVQQRVTQALAHQSVPFARVVEALRPPAIVGVTPVFQAMFNLLDVSNDGLPALPGLRASEWRGEHPVARFDLSLDIRDNADTFECAFIYATDVFDEATVAQLADDYVNLIDQIVAEPALALGNLRVGGRALPSAAAGVAAVAAGAAVALPTWPFVSLADRLFALARSQPSARAVHAEDAQLDYAQLATSARALAARLLRAGVQPEERVGICVQRASALPVALYGVLGSGAAYVPLDPDYPPERLQYIIADAGIRRVVVDAVSRERVGALLAPLDCIAVVSDEEDRDAHDVALPTPHPDQLAYVIYTSGSTGQPKGVGVTHRNVTRLLDATHAQFGFNASDVWSCFHSYAFDFSVWEYFGALSFGGVAVVVPHWVARSPQDFHALLRDTHVTVLNQTPSAFLPLTQIERDLNAPLTDVRCVIFGGEKLEPATLSRWLAWRGKSAPRLVNMYGITETTVHVTARDVVFADTEAANAPSLIGAPIADLSLHVLDADLNPAPDGVCGELCVGGAGLARAYLGRAALTASRFVPDPFGAPGARLYRSGDVARRRRDGELEYLGRNDAQVKIRGFRIEPGEIQAVLLTHPAIRSAVVVPGADPQGGLRLIAYYVGGLNGKTDMAALREHVAARLPAHMVPAAFVALDALPLTLNGKLDVRALPAPDEIVAGRSRVAPTTPQEIALAEIWQDVLGGALPGADDDFFALGGHSLSAVKVVARVRQHLGVTLPLQSVFSLPVLAQLAQAIAAATSAEGERAEPLIARRPAGLQHVPLSFAQERLWVLWQLEPESVAYHVPGAVRLSGSLDAAAVRAAFDTIVARHEALRTTFATVDGKPVQRIADAARYDWRETSLDRADPAALADALRACVSQPFDLEHGPLLRVALLSSGESEHVLAVVMHHIVSDGWSMDVLIEEFCACYEASRRGFAAELPPLPIQCADHAHWERADGGRREADLGWWRERLGGEQPVLDLPLARARPAKRSAAGGRCIRHLDPATTRALRDFSQREGATLFMVLLACYQTLLHRYSGQNDIRIGIPVANRERLETEALIGFFINTLVIRGAPEGHRPFDALLAATRAEVVAAQAHASVPFAQLVDAVQPQRDLGLTPLFQTMFNLQVTPAEQFASLSGITVSALDLPELGGETAQFDLTLDVIDQGASLRVSFGYTSDIFDRATVEQLADHYLELVDAVLAAPGRALAALPLTLAAGPRAAAVQPYLSVPERFALQALAQPAASALRSPATPAEPAFDYATLAARATRIGAVLHAAGVRDEARVGLCVSRSPSMVAALFGIWHAGAAFVPLDPDYPPERLAQIVADAGIEHVVVDRSSAARLGSVLAGLTLHVLEEDMSTAPASSFQPRAPLAAQLAYVMYTSGSTGVPKGVAMTHAALSVHVDDVIARFGVHAGDRVLQFSTINFDAALEQLLPALCVGACVVLRGPDLWSWPEFNAVLRDEAVTVADLPTAFWQQWLRDLPAALPALRLVTIGGEALNGAALARWQSSPLRDVRFENTYGPTEAAISALSRRTAEADRDAPVVTIGLPYPGRIARLLDAWSNPLPAGAAGELCIGGDALARGYLGRPATTAERFVPDPFGPPGSRLYRTGDVCVLRAGAAAHGFDYVGRDDRQVKLRGYRIELTEVETALRALPGVREAVALISGADDARKLLAYAVVDEPEREGAADALHAALAARLPAYMTPAAVVPLAALPLTPNGKVDKRALPQPLIGESDTPRVTTAACDEREARLLAIWRGVLGRNEIGVDDNFFALGGDSILAIQAISRARAEGMVLTVRELFEHQSVAALAQRIPQAAPTRAYRELAGPLTLTPIQRWFFSEHPDGPAHWNQSVLLAANERLSMPALQAAVQAVMGRHDALRLRFAHDANAAGNWTQRSVPAEAGRVAHVDLSGEADWQAALSARGAEVQASLDIGEGPPWRAVQFDVPDGGSRLLLVVHHLSIDGVSWRILLEELAQAYEQTLAGKPVALPAQSLSWGEWTEALSSHAQQPSVRDELGYWRTQLSAASNWSDEVQARGGLPLAARLDDAEHTLGASQVIRRKLDEARTRALLQEASAAPQGRVDELLLAALVKTLAGWSKAAGVLVELEGHGREEVIDGVDLTRTVGWFTTRYPVWFEAADDGAKTLASVKTTLRGVPHKGLHYGVLEYLAGADEQAAIAALPRSQVSFNYLGQFGQSGPGEGAGESRMRIATGEHAGQAAGAHTAFSYALELNALIVDGALSIDWRYLPGLIDTARAQALADTFEAQLDALLADRDSNAAAATHSFDSDLAGEDLDALLDQIGD